MKKFKKIAMIAFWCVLLTGLVISLGFVNKEQEEMLCAGMDVHVNQDNDLYFLDNIDVERLIHDRGDSIKGQPMHTVNVPEMEKALNSHADIANAEVYMTIDGTLKVDVKQRRPVIRIFNANGESYYLDEDGKPMPLSDKYTAKVLVANGNLFEPYASRYIYTVDELAKDSALKATSMLDELFAMANYINKDEFWKAQVQQIFVNSDKDMEMTRTWRLFPSQVISGSSSETRRTSIQNSGSSLFFIPRV
jgi:cell division protein FtsQ